MDARGSISSLRGSAAPVRGKALHSLARLRLALGFLHFSRRSRRHIVAHSVSCGLVQGGRKARECGRHTPHHSQM